MYTKLLITYTKGRHNGTTHNSKKWAKIKQVLFSVCIFALSTVNNKFWLHVCDTWHFAPSVGPSRLTFIQHRTLTWRVPKWIALFAAMQNRRRGAGGHTFQQACHVFHLTYYTRQIIKYKCPTKIFFVLSKY